MNPAVYRLSTCTLALTLVLAGCGRQEPAAAPAVESSAPAPVEILDFDRLGSLAASVITEDALRRVVAEIASDRYQGRGPASPGDELTQQFLERELAAAGYAPGMGNGSYRQPFDLISLDADQPPQWTFNAGDSVLRLQQHDDFIAASGVQATEARVINAEVVFVGYGIQAPEYGWDDYKGADLRGKVLLMLNNDPDWEPDLFEGVTRLYYGRWDYKYFSAAAQGAAGAIIIHTTPSAGYPYQVVQTSWTGEQFELPAGAEPRIQVKTWVTEDAARRLVGMAGLDLDNLVEQAHSQAFAPVPLGVTTSITLPVAMSSEASANVIGILEGSDPELRDEAVIITAHHDHLGMAPPGADPDADRIYNGAHDNASGVAMVLGIARAFAALPQPPRRSIIINLVGAEEQGLLGSLYYANNPTVAPGRIAANLNIDGGSKWGRARDITFVGYGKSSLDTIVDEVAAFQGRTVKPDQFPDRGSFYRSDQFNFARIGVPATYLDPGTEVIGMPEGWGAEQINRFTDVDYHQPSDELDDSWSFAGAAQDAIFNFLVAYRVANMDEMPRWNPGDEFEAARLRSLQALE